MENFGKFLLSERWRAIVFAALLGAVPFVGWLSVVIVGFVTLRKGFREGFWVLLGSMLPAVPFLLQGGSWFWLALYNLIYSNCLLWVLAGVLRSTVSWRSTVLAAVAIAGGSVVVIHLGHSDIVAWWHSYFKGQFEALLKLGDAASAVSSEERVLYQQLLDSGALDQLSRVMTGMLAAMTVMMTGIYLALARWWQAALFNPGGLRRELYASRFDFKPLILALLCLFSAWLGIDLGWDLLPIFAVFYVFSGLTLIHCWAQVRLRQPLMFLVPFYLMLIVMRLYVLIVVIGLAVLDGFIDFRKRFDLLSNLEGQQEEIND